jgi:hypothetical protein
MREDAAEWQHDREVLAAANSVFIARNNPNPPPLTSSLPA